MNLTTQFLKKDAAGVVILLLTLFVGFFSLATQNIFMGLFFFVENVSQRQLGVMMIVILFPLLIDLYQSKNT